MKGIRILLGFKKKQYTDIGSLHHLLEGLWKERHGVTRRKLEEAVKENRVLAGQQDAAQQALALEKAEHQRQVESPKATLDAAVVETKVQH